jgi:hypothetical protein
MQMNDYHTRTGGHISAAFVTPYGRLEYMSSQSNVGNALRSLMERSLQNSAPQLVKTYGSTASLAACGLKATADGTDPLVRTADKIEELLEVSMKRDPAALRPYQTALGQAAADVIGACLCSQLP